jgi:hypothetical protein
LAERHANLPVAKKERWGLQSKTRGIKGETYS